MSMVIEGRLLHSTTGNLRVKIAGSIKECWERAGANEMLGHTQCQSFQNWWIRRTKAEIGCLVSNNWLHKLFGRVLVIMRKKRLQDQPAVREDIIRGQGQQEHFCCVCLRRLTKLQIQGCSQEQDTHININIWTLWFSCKSLAHRALWVISPHPSSTLLWNGDYI